MLNKEIEEDFNGQTVYFKYGDYMVHYCYEDYLYAIEEEKQNYGNH